MGNDKDLPSYETLTDAQIEKRAEEYAYVPGSAGYGPVLDAFMNGAKWAVEQTKQTRLDSLPVWDSNEEDCQDWLKREIAKDTPFVISSAQLQQILDELERVWGFSDGG